MTTMEQYECAALLLYHRVRRLRMELDELATRLDTSRRKAHAKPQVVAAERTFRRMSRDFEKWESLWQRLPEPIRESVLKGQVRYPRYEFLDESVLGCLLPPKQPGDAPRREA